MTEDFERESQKDSVYLSEAYYLLEQKIMQAILEEENRKPAQIILLDPDKILKKDENEPNPLPF